MQLVWHCRVRADLLGGIYFWFIILAVLVWIPDRVIEVNAGIFYQMVMMVV